MAVGVCVVVGVTLVGVPRAEARVIVCKKKNKVALRIGTCKGKEEVGALNGSGVDVAELPKVPAAVQADTATTATSATSAATAANADTLDGVDSAELQRAIRWALVSADGTTIIAQSGGISIVPEAVTGIYALNFGTSLLGRSLVATLKGGLTQAGGISAAICGGPAAGPETSFCNVTGLANTTNEVAIATVDTSGTAADRSFYLAVLP
jgi:hypothetical protein